ncbi:MAG: ATP cone domain-containing protein, partial [Candidatus Babeliales bacterium]
MQSDVFFIRKRSGQKEEFSTKKLQRSLQKVGADQKTISQIIEKIKKEKPLNTNAIHEFIIESLGK